jgi:hypothetical protein
MPCFCLFVSSCTLISRVLTASATEPFPRPCQTASLCDLAAIRILDFLGFVLAPEVPMFHRYIIPSPWSGELALFCDHALAFRSVEAVVSNPGRDS